MSGECVAGLSNCQFQTHWRQAVCLSAVICLVSSLINFLPPSLNAACIQRCSFTQPCTRFKTHTSLARHSRYPPSFLAPTPLNCALRAFYRLNKINQSRPSHSETPPSSAGLFHLSPVSCVRALILAQTHPDAPSGAGAPAPSPHRYS
jgi:hypothetical protein